MEQNKNIGFHWVKAITAAARVGFGEEWQPGAIGGPIAAILAALPALVICLGGVRL